MGVVLQAISDIVLAGAKVNLVDPVKLKDLPKKSAISLFGIMQTALIDRHIAEALEEASVNTGPLRQQPKRNCKMPANPTQKQLSVFRLLRRIDLLNKLTRMQYEVFFDFILCCCYAFMNGDLKLRVFKDLHAFMDLMEELDIALPDPRQCRPGERLYFEPRQLLFYYKEPFAWENEERRRRDAAKQPAQAKSTPAPPPPASKLSAKQFCCDKTIKTFKRLVEIPCGVQGEHNSNLRPLIFFSELVTGKKN
jgi:hypothetical protein